MDSFSPLSGSVRNTTKSTVCGVSYAIRYVGAIGVNVSIKSVDFSSRTMLARECIHRICEDARVKLPSNRQFSKEISPFLGQSVDLLWSMTSVCLTVSRVSITVEEFRTGALMFSHKLGSVSFACGGDADTLDFIGYIAKDDTFGRKCFVFECSCGLSHEIINCIGQAFQQGYKEYKISKNMGSPVMSTAFSNPNRFDPLEDCNNLVPAPTIPMLLAPEPEAQLSLQPWLSGHKPPAATQDSHNPTEKPLFITYPMSSAASTEADRCLVPSLQPRTDLALQGCLEPVGEPWYVGKMSRNEAESLLQFDGDFLVRASSQQAGQFVLSGLQAGKRRHLLLVTPEGQVRTKDRMFDSIQRLIDFHLRSGIPIRSADSELKLVFPVSLKKLS